MRLKERILHFKPSASPDVVAYRLYYTPVPAPPTYDSPNTELGMPEADAETGKLFVDLAELEAMTSIDGIFNLGIVAVDDAGNESSMLILSQIPLDFTAPDAPTEAEVVTS